ncbi:hypothetical protein BRADI_2g02084v3 [Brachypodium distachyon]|nr:hypothetical protein BRADI_2g02084v3 [Brachypodium distachyon]
MESLEMTPMGEYIWTVSTRMSTARQSCSQIIMLLVPGKEKMRFFLFIPFFLWAANCRAGDESFSLRSLVRLSDESACAPCLRWHRMAVRIGFQMAKWEELCPCAVPARSKFTLEPLNIVEGTRRGAVRRRNRVSSVLDRAGCL